MIHKYWHIIRYTPLAVGFIAIAFGVTMKPKDIEASYDKAVNYSEVNFDITEPVVFAKVEPQAGHNASMIVKEPEMILEPVPSLNTKLSGQEKVDEIIQSRPATDAPWQKNAIAFKDDPAKPNIIIIIDDLGMSYKYTKEIIDLKGPFTLAYLPYAKDVEKFVKDGQKNGHEIMVHMPMEPMDASVDPGPIALKTGMSEDDFVAMLDKGLGAFDGYIGVNNHMGSRLTQDKKAMSLLMGELSKRGLAFVDSRTISTSVAADTAKAYNLPYAERDVFLDHIPTKDNVLSALSKAEGIAKEYGSVIAIGHPKKETLEALNEWLPTIKEKGFELAPVSTVLTKKPSVVSSAPAEPLLQQPQ